MKHDSKIDTLSAVIIGYILTGDFDAYTQNALGNWFILLGQILETNSAFMMTKPNTSNVTYDDLNNALNRIYSEINKIKK